MPLAVYDYMDDSLAEAMDDMERELIKVCVSSLRRERDSRDTAWE